MPRLDEPMDPEIAESLEAMDATLAGDAVDPRHAEMAELALMLRAERPGVSLAFKAELDQRVRERFQRPGPARPVMGVRRRGWVLAPAAGLAASVVVAVVIVASGSSTPTGVHVNRDFSSVAHVQAATVRAPANLDRALSVKAAPQSTAAYSAATVGSLQPALVGPVPNGRKDIQSGQLALTTSPTRIDYVAQEVFEVAGRDNAIVQSSTVTQGQGGYATLQLSIPSGSLSQAMAALSTLPHARVSSRTDTTQDVDNQYVADQRALADARALRTDLLKQLAAATTQAELDSLTARIHDAEASISSDEATLHSLQHQIAYSQVTVTVNGGSIPVASGHQSGFTLGRAAHDAGRVLTVAAGVALIGAAAALPLLLLLALGWWARAAFLRRRREQALDLV